MTQTLEKQNGTPMNQSENFEVRLARSEEEIALAQSLRYRVFIEEMNGSTTPENEKVKKDIDDFDQYADHLLVIDPQAPEEEKVVGTYRLIRRSVAEKNIGFYTETEFNIKKLKNYEGEILEIGRSCVAPAYRTRAAIQLLWRGIAAYVLQFNVELIFGCASIPTTNIEEIKEQLSYLYHFHLAPPALRTKALNHRYVQMNLIPAEMIDHRKALSQLPPLIKGYLRIGGFIGDGAIIDHDFQSTDVCIIAKRDLIPEKYFGHYKRTSQPFVVK